MSHKAALVAVVMAFSTGLIASLALRPDAPSAGPARAGGAAEIVRWRLPSAYGTNLPGLGDNPLDLARHIGAASGGRIRVEVFEPGELVPAFRIVDAVRDGKVAAGYTWLGYDQGKLPASVLFGAVPFGMEPWEFTAWWYEGGGREHAEEIYGSYGVRPILCGLIGPETAGWFRHEIVQLDDLRGLKIRFAGLGGKVMQRLGASVTMLPGGEIFQALEKGAIDAAEFSLPAVDARLGFDRIASINYFPGWHQPFTAFHLVVHDDAWNALDDSGRAIVEIACSAATLRNFSRAEALQGPVLRRFEEEGEVSVRRLPDAILHELRRVSDEVLEEESRADADFARTLRSQRHFAADYARWRQIAYPGARFRRER